MKILRIAAALAVLIAGPLHAQGTGIAFGTPQDGDQPVEVTAEELQLDQAAGTAVFSGNVIVGQGDMRLTAPRVDVTYATDADGNSTGGIDRLHATGGVTLTSGGEAAEGQEAVYTVGSGQVVMTGDVLLTQGQNALAGEKLTVGLDDGQGVMEGNVRVVFQPQDEAAEPAAQ
ncbi:lipopolysaccharide transport periplasmic protein LptA [Tropicimonas sp. IMCC34011]|uniref:lipopolysaccharide transport periplasmic protein LptA n=1 Tax=Tropicimonas sp. IMCC34011 TaxID=2248759 RepID=UPI000E220F65|nr:lipopolysaccharide transport periplasmic protein LptA [Tropicimonas sp. IMCC34011]